MFATSPGQTEESEGRWELLRALGSLTVDGPESGGAVFGALGLDPWTRADHTRVFVLDLAPYASIYLDPEGKLGGACVDQIAGVWRVLGLDPPREPDHLLSLIGLYAALGSAIKDCRSEVARKRVEVAARTVLAEHIHPWIFVYLAAVESYSATATWAALVQGVLREELSAWPQEDVLPLTLRDAPKPDLDDLSAEKVYELATVPVVSGGVVTFGDLETMGSRAGLGVRRGERRFVLRSMLEQGPRETLCELGAHFRTWEGRALGEGSVASWWKERAAATADALFRAADE